MTTCRYTSTPLHTVSIIVPTSSSDIDELHNSDTLEKNDKLTQKVIESHVLISESENITNKLEIRNFLT